MTREQAIAKFAQNKTEKGVIITDEYKKYIIDTIYDDFEEELKKAYIEGSNDNYKALKEAGKLK